MDIVTRTVRQSLNQIAVHGKRVVVGLSGGVDSVVLLHCLARIAHDFDVALSALHVHHGLSRNADAWSRFCEDLCAQLDVPCNVVHVRIERGGKPGLEASAREARYRVYRAQKADVIALAHHRDDQAETVLLQLLRGAGVRGLSAMPLVRRLDRTGQQRLARPLLDVTRSQIMAYTAAAGLQWVEDESNADPAMDRNFLRAHVMPVITQRFRGAAITLQRAAENAAEAARLLDELARLDATGATDEISIGVNALAALPGERARNLLRWFIERQGLSPPPRGQLEEGLRQAVAARRDATVEVGLGDAVLRRHRGRIYLEAARSGAPGDWERRWCGEEAVELPGTLGTVQFERAVGIGLSLQRLRAPTVLRARHGGERMRIAPRARSRTLKNLLHEAGIPHWQRDRLPLLFCVDDLIWVPEIGIDCRYLAQDGEPGILPRWVLPGDH